MAGLSDRHSPGQLPTGPRHDRRRAFVSRWLLSLSSGSPCPTATQRLTAATIGGAVKSVHPFIILPPSAAIARDWVLSPSPLDTFQNRALLSW